MTDKFDIKGPKRRCSEGEMGGWDRLISDKVLGIYENQGTETSTIIESAIIWMTLS